MTIPKHHEIIWTPDQVAELWMRQSMSKVHPYTCPNRDDNKHHEFNFELGLLIPTVRGWICPFCDYKQYWSHETGGPPK